jgi:hypothetical protein
VASHRDGSYTDNRYEEIGNEIFLFSIFKEAFWGVKGTRIRQINGVPLEGKFAMCACQAGFPLPSQIRP